MTPVSSAITTAKERTGVRGNPAKTNLVLWVPGVNGNPSMLRYSQFIVLLSKGAAMERISYFLAPRGRRSSLMVFGVLGVLLSGFGSGYQDEVYAQASSHSRAEVFSVEEDSAPIDQEAHRGEEKSSQNNPPHPHSTSGALSPSVAASIASIHGGLAAKSQGFFGPVFDWPIIPLATMLMPNGHVLAYGTNLTGKQGAAMDYTVWNPATGEFDTTAHTISTDIFCAAQAHFSDGKALLLGGDATVNGTRNYSNSDVNIFNPADNSLIRQSNQMTYKRWYATAVMMPNGNHIVLGGRSDRKGTTGTTVDAFASIPEIRNALTGGWTNFATTYAAVYEDAFGKNSGSWFYPRAWVHPKGGIFILGHSGKTFKLDVGTGLVTTYATTTSASKNNLSSVMYAPGQILSVRQNKKAVVVNINGSGEPTVTPTHNLANDHQYGTLTVLADGKVLMNGGTSGDNSSLVGAFFDAELWDPNTGLWTPAARAAEERLYHSSALLLPDGTVLTGGGGAPGPVTQLNGEIYYPPYLFETDGTLATQPTIGAAPSTVGYNQRMTIGSSTIIQRITLLRVGAGTHTFNNETRFFNLKGSALGSSTTVEVTSPASANVAPPGHYMLFVWNAAGVPSKATIIQIE